VRVQVLADHRELESRLAALARMTTAMHTSLHMQAIRDAFESLASFLTAHMAYEDEFLAPVLRDASDRSGNLARRMIEHHVEQRVELLEFRTLIASPNTNREKLKEAIDKFSDLLAVDIAHEESGLLSRDTLGG
jgi:iron-sulfur cluster repair protein YtfE (RIC family)